MAEKMRRDAMQRYENEAAQIIERHQNKQVQMADDQAALLQKQGYLKSLMTNLDLKASSLISSLSLPPRPLTAPLVDQSWRLLQNWVFSLITDQEKCVRYARIKACQQIKHAQGEKLRYQEGRVNQVVQLAAKIKQFPIAKVNLQPKPLRPLKPQLLEYLRQNYGNVQYEHMGTVRGKPNLKFAAKNMQYSLHHSDSQKFPSLSLLLRDVDRILLANRDLLHIECPKIKLDLSQIDLNQLILNDALSPFQEPDVTSRKELRVFVCAKEAKDHKKELTAFQDMIDDGWTFQVESESGMPACQIKRLKNTNQLKIQPSDSGQFSILSECKLRHLINSKVFSQYFEVSPNSQEVVSSIANFYIIEENSLFHKTPNHSGILTHQRKIRHFRRLSDFEVVLLLCKSLGHLTSGAYPQPIEMKVSLEILKKLHNFDSEQMMPQSPPNGQAKEWVQQNYVIVSCMSGEHLLKQYLVRFPRPNNNTEDQEGGFCHFPNCLQHISSRQQPKIEPRYSQEVTQSQTQLVTLKKARPESANNRNTGQSFTQTTNARLQRRLTRLPTMLDLEIYDSPLIKLLAKRFKQSLQQPQANPQQQQQVMLNKDKSAKVISQQPQPQQIQTLDASQLSKNLPSSRATLQFCQQHFELEQFINSKLNINLQPIQLRPTSFHKALKNFSQWKDELKGSLANDLFAKNAKGCVVMSENIQKILSFALQQMGQSKVQVDVSAFVEVVYQQQPQVINYLENYYNWIFKVSQMQKSIYQSNPTYQEANEHYISQLKAFNLNIKQARENEQYLATELRRWLHSPQFAQTIHTSLGSTTFAQLVEIVRSRDVIFKFQQFQALAERINTGALISEAAQEMLPRIGEGKHQTHTMGFFKGAGENGAFSSNKVIDKLTMIYGGGFPQGMQNSIQGSTGTNFMKKQPPSDKFTSSSGFIDQKTPLNPIQRKFSAGTKKQEEYYSQQQEQVQQSPQTFKSKQEILLPPPIVNNSSKQRANSAHKYNQNATLSKPPGQQLNTLQQQDLYSRPVTNISQYDNTTNLPPPQSNKQYQAVAQTYQQPPPRFNPLPTSLVPIQNAYRNTRPILAQGPQLPPNNLLLAQQQQQRQLKQNIIIAHHTYGSGNPPPQSTVSSKAGGSIIPSNTSIGFHNMQQLASGSGQHRVSSAHGDKDRKRLVEGGKQKKGKKKSQSSGVKGEV
ncbi:hypothetical protein FGO68_gene14170 [Halteria grandinella]|uniref:Uncharacterized protein n=1 Tax=Halteria grandinella TaxID=5974 RepID=A0A8J8NHZ3_HALGN|nr:hypothetical protein FGO68_gene14170 [Halteria grandinella]